MCAPAIHPVFGFSFFLPSASQCLSYRILQKIDKNSFKLVVKMVRNRSLGEVWMVLGANRGVLVASWGVLDVSCGVLGAS